MIFDEDTQIYEWKSCHSYYQNKKKAYAHFISKHLIDPHMWLIWKAICKNMNMIYKHLKIHKGEISG